MDWKTVKSKQIFRVRKPEFMNSWTNKYLTQKNIKPASILTRKKYCLEKKSHATNHLNILSLNIRSLPKHDGEHVCLLEALETKFHIVVLTAIGF